MASCQASCDSSATESDSMPSPERSQDFNDLPRKNNLYVKNLPSEVDDAALTAMFQAHGSVVSCRVLCDHAGISKQVAFVQMETRHQALHAIDALHDTRPPAQGPASKALHVALAETKQDRQRKARQGGSGHAPNNQGRPKRSFSRSFLRAPSPVSAPQLYPIVSQLPQHGPSYYQPQPGSPYYFQAAPYAPYANPPYGPAPMYPPYAYHAAPHMLSAGPFLVHPQHMGLPSGMMAMPPHAGHIEGHWASTPGMHVWAPIHKAPYEPAALLLAGVPTYNTWHS